MLRRYALPTQKHITRYTAIRWARGQRHKENASEGARCLSSPLQNHRIDLITRPISGERNFSFTAGKRFTRRSGVQAMDARSRAEERSRSGGTENN